MESSLLLVKVLLGTCYKIITVCEFVTITIGSNVIYEILFINVN